MSKSRSPQVRGAIWTLQAATVLDRRQRAGKGGTSGLLDGNVAQPGIQFVGRVVVAAWRGAAIYAILKLIDLSIGLRVTRDVETQGLDLNLHGEVVP